MREAGPNTFSLIRYGLERTGQANEAVPVAVSAVDVDVTNVGRSGQASSQSVFDVEVGAPSVVRREVVVTPVNNLRRDGELVGCLEGVGGADSPFSGEVVAFDWPTPMRRRCRACPGRGQRDNASDCAVFVAKVVNAVDGDGCRAEGGRSNGFEANFVAGYSSDRSSMPRPTVKASAV